LLVDNQERVIGALCGQPKDKSWAETLKLATEALREARRKLQKVRPVINDRRGSFGGLQTGITRGSMKVSHHITC
jgi:hypothetical protein